MIMGGDKKKIAALIVARVRPSGDSEDVKKRNQGAFEKRAGEPESDGMDEGLLSASEEMISAIHSKDAHGFATALQDFISMADKSDEESEEGESEDEEDKKHPILG